MLAENIKKKLIQAAIDAPSADNSQPFLYQWQENDLLSLFIDPERAGKASDNRFVLSDIALGAVIENIVITAHAEGFTTQEHYLPDPNNHYHVSDISFSTENVAQDSTQNITQNESALANCIDKRATDRRFPFKGEINERVKAVLTTAGEHYNCNTKWYMNKQEKKSVIPVIQQAESIRFKSQILHQELFSTIHFGDPDSQEGMPIEVLAIEKPAQPLFKQLKKWSVMNFFNKLGAFKMLGIRSVKIPLLFSPSLALITIKGNSRESVINGGRALQRFWLTCTEQGIAVQPYAAPGIFSLGFVQCEPVFKSSLDDIANQMNTITGTNEYGLMFLRLGYNTPIKAKTHRRHADSFVKER